MKIPKFLHMLRSPSGPDYELYFWVGEPGKSDKYAVQGRLSHDPITAVKDFGELEDNILRLAIKRVEIDSFQDRDIYGAGTHEERQELK